MKAFFKLIRWPNLLIVILTMVLMRYAIIEPLLNKINVSMYSMQETQKIRCHFNLHGLIFSSWYSQRYCITAGGYVINDYFDIKTDLINRGKVIVGTKIPRRQAMMWHNIFNIAGVAAGFYISAESRIMYGWDYFFLIVSGLLYFYSASYKRQFLIGNLVVAITHSYGTYACCYF